MIIRLIKMLGSARLLLKVAIVLCMTVFSIVPLLARQKEDVGGKKARFEYGIGFCAQFFGYSKTSPNSFMSISGDPHLNPQGLGMPLYVNVFLPHGWGVEYSPTLRKDHIRYLDSRPARDNLANEWMIDHHFSMLSRLQANDIHSPVIGIGFSIISPGETTDGPIRFSRTNPGRGIIGDPEIDLQFSGLHLLMRWDLFRSGLWLEPKLMFVSAGNISYKLNAAFTMMHFITVKYALSRYISKAKVLRN